MGERSNFEALWYELQNQGSPFPPFLLGKRVAVDMGAALSAAADLQLVVFVRALALPIPFSSLSSITPSQTDNHRLGR